MPQEMATCVYSLNDIRGIRTTERHAGLCITNKIIAFGGVHEDTRRLIIEELAAMIADKCP